MSKPIRVSLVHLGCARNQIDSEVMLGRMAQDGIHLCGDVQDAEVAVINTCSFIGPAREESFAAIGTYLERKKKGYLKGVLVAGCLAEKFRDDIHARAPGVDAVLPISDYSQISDVVRRVMRKQNAEACPSGRPKGKDSDMIRVLTTPPSYAYLRISEGCDHTCTFCIIPSIRGAMRSKPIESLVEEARNLAGMGVRELVIVAEDSTWYGRDLYGEPRLPELVEKISETEGISWIRILYAYPNAFPWKLTKVMRENPKVLPYLDIPIQHIADNVLRSMRRAGSGGQVREILNRLRDEVPGIVLRTTFITGFPGETEEDFEELLSFVKTFRFERMSGFPFSDEEMAASFRLPGKVAPEAAKERLDALMEAQTALIQDANRSKIGRSIEVLFDEYRDGALWGRTQADAPEVDCGVIRLGENGGLQPGSLAEVKVTGVSDDGFDLMVQ